MKNPRLLIQEDILDDTILQWFKPSHTKEKIPLKEIEYKPDEKIKKIRELPEEELAKAIHTLLNN